MSRLLIVLGLILAVAGLLWPWLVKLGLGHLPGDIIIQREHFHLYIPLTSAFVVSVVLSLILWLMHR